MRQPRAAAIEADQIALSQLAADQILGGADGDELLLIFEEHAPAARQIILEGTDIGPFAVRAAHAQQTVPLVRQQAARSDP